MSTQPVTPEDEVGHERPGDGEEGSAPHEHFLRPESSPDGPAPTGYEEGAVPSNDPVEDEASVEEPAGLAAPAEGTAGGSGPAAAAGGADQNQATDDELRAAEERRQQLLRQRAEQMDLSNQGPASAAPRDNQALPGVKVEPGVTHPIEAPNRNRLNGESDISVSEANAHQQASRYIDPQKALEMTDQAHFKGESDQGLAASAPSAAPASDGAADEIAAGQGERRMSGEVETENEQRARPKPPGDSRPRSSGNAQASYSSGRSPQRNESKADPTEDQTSNKQGAGKTDGKPRREEVSNVAGDGLNGLANVVGGLANLPGKVFDHVRTGFAERKSARNAGADRFTPEAINRYRQARVQSTGDDVSHLCEQITSEVSFLRQTGDAALTPAAEAKARNNLQNHLNGVKLAVDQHVDALKAADVPTVDLDQRLKALRKTVTDTMGTVEDMVNEKGDDTAFKKIAEQMKAVMEGLSKALEGIGNFFRAVGSRFAGAAGPAMAPG